MLVKGKTGSRETNEETNEETSMDGQEYEQLAAGDPREGHRQLGLKLAQLLDLTGCVPDGISTLFRGLRAR